MISYLSQHLKNALALLPTVFIQSFSVELFGSFMVTLKNTEEGILNIKINPKCYKASGFF